MIIITVDESARKPVHKVKNGDDYHQEGCQPGTVVLSPEKYRETIERLLSDEEKAKAA